MKKIVLLLPLVLYGITVQGQTDRLTGLASDNIAGTKITTVREALKAKLANLTPEEKQALMDKIATAKEAVRASLEKLTPAERQTLKANLTGLEDALTALKRGARGLPRLVEPLNTLYGDIKVGFDEIVKNNFNTATPEEQATGGQFIDEVIEMVKASPWMVRIRTIEMTKQPLVQPIKEEMPATMP